MFPVNSMSVQFPDDGVHIFDDLSSSQAFTSLIDGKLIILMGRRRHHHAPREHDDERSRKGLFFKAAQKTLPCNYVARHGNSHWMASQLAKSAVMECHL